MKNIFLRLLLFLITTILFAQKTDKVSVLKNEQGMKLTAYGMPFMVNGMNSDFTPVDINTVNANFWENPDDIIQAAFVSGMFLLKNMGVNTTSQCTLVPIKWIRYIYENYSIYTMLNHSIGPYGLTPDVVWVRVEKYCDARTQKFLLKEIENLAQEDKDTPGASFIADSVNPSSGSFERRLLSDFETGNGDALDAVVKQANVFGAATLNTEYEILFDLRESPLIDGVFFVEFFSELSGGGVSKSEIVTGGPHLLTPGWNACADKVTRGSDVSGSITL